MNSCDKHPSCRLLNKNSGRVRLHDIYRVRLGRRQGQDIWIVDGDRVFTDLYPAFIMGGNDQRYRFNPQDDVWIDNRIGVEELEYTIAHELIERKLMRERGWSYDRAHDSGLALERVMRDRNKKSVERRIRALLTSAEGKDAQANAAKIAGVYRAFFRTVQGLKVWIVDGPKVRHELHGDFCFAGHTLKYDFIPDGEIWLDSAMSAEQVHYALLHEIAELKHMRNDEDYDDAYSEALKAQLDERHHQAKVCASHEARLAPVTYGVRERGAKVQTPCHASKRARKARSRRG